MVILFQILNLHFQKPLFQIRSLSRVPMLMKWPYLSGGWHSTYYRWRINDCKVLQIGSKIRLSCTGFVPIFLFSVLHQILAFRCTLFLSFLSIFCVLGHILLNVFVTPVMVLIYFCSDNVIPLHLLSNMQNTFSLSQLLSLFLISLLY